MLLRNDEETLKRLNSPSGRVSAKSKDSNSNPLYNEDGTRKTAPNTRGLGIEGKDAMRLQFKTYPWIFWFLTAVLIGTFIYLLVQLAFPDSPNNVFSDYEEDES